MKIHNSGYPSPSFDEFQDHGSSLDETTSSRSSRSSEMHFRDATVEELSRSSESSDRSSMEFRRAESRDVVKTPFPFASRALSILRNASSSSSHQTIRTNSSKSISSDEPLWSKSFEEKSTRSKEEIITQGELLSVADFKKIANEKRFSFRGTTYRELIHALHHYEKNKDHWNVAQHLEELASLEAKTKIYFEKKEVETEEYQKRSSSSEGASQEHLMSHLMSKGREKKQVSRQNSTHAAALLLSGIYNKKMALLLEQEQLVISSREVTAAIPRESHTQEESLLHDLKTTLESLAPTCYTLSLTRHEPLPEEPELSAHALARCDAMKEELVGLLIKQDEEGSLSSHWPALLDQKQACALKKLTLHELETIFKKHGIPSADIKSAQARLVSLQKHIDVVQKITTMNDAKKAEGIELDVGTQIGFERYFRHATRKELEAIGSYRPAPHLQGAAIVTNWNSVS